jgi:hypothetical protein
LLTYWKNHYQIQNYRDANGAYMNGGIGEEIPISPYVLDVEPRSEQGEKEVVEAYRLVPPSFNGPDRAIGDGELKQLTISSSNIKGLTGSNKENPIFKKAIRIGDEQPPVIVAVIHESIVQDLHINENTWFEEIPTSEGIFLKLSSEEIPSRDLIENPRGYRSKDGKISEQHSGVVPLLIQKLLEKMPT